MGREIHDDALKAQSERLKVLLNLPWSRTGDARNCRTIYKVQQASGQTIAELEAQKSGITIERLKRKDQFIDVSPEITLQTDDVVLIVGRRASVVSIAENIGSELQSSGMEMVMDTTDVILRNSKYINRTLGDVKANTPDYLKHGIYVLGIKRQDETQLLNDETILRQGDVVTVYGTKSDLERLVKEGKALPESLKTDWIFHGWFGGGSTNWLICCAYR
jgi:uncharacterized transporter YbjL